MEGVLSEETDSQTIRVNFEIVVEQGSELLGIFYHELVQKNFFPNGANVFLCCEEIN